MKKIIHLSDLHVGYEEKSKDIDTSDTLEDMIDRLIYLFDKDEHIVVITGDIVDDATNDDQMQKAIDHLERIKKAGFNLLVAPGNHDYGTGTKATEEGMKKFKNAVFDNEEEGFPKFDAIDGIAFIGLDSMQGEIEDGEGNTWADGKLGETQLEELNHLLSKDPDVAACQYKVVYLHHHPIYIPKYLKDMIKKVFHGLEDGSALKKIIEKHQIHALLFGHDHDGHSWNGNWGVERAYDAGSSTGKRKKSNAKKPHRVIDLSAPVGTDYDAQL